MNTFNRERRSNLSSSLLLLYYFHFVAIFTTTIGRGVIARRSYQFVVIIDMMLVEIASLCSFVRSSTFSPLILLFFFVCVMTLLGLVGLFS